MRPLPAFLRPTLAALLGGAAILAFAQTPPPSANPPAAVNPPVPGGPGGGRGPAGPQPEIKLLKQFDKDGDGLLNASERKAAREYLAANPVPRRGRGGRGGGATQQPPKPGEQLTAADVKTYGKEPLYDATTLRTLFFTFEDADWEKEMEEFNRTDLDLAATLVV
ncbi:MAG: hypothetical protein ABIR80_09760, partial [Opitutaceae bacterium]